MITITQISFSDETLNVFIENLRKEYALYEEMIELCEQEKEFIEQSNMVKLREFLIRKHEILDEIVKIEKEKSKMQNVWENAKGLIPREERQIILEFIDDFKLLIDKLVKAQKFNQDLMNFKHDEKVSSFQKIQKGIKMNRAYAHYSDGVPDTRYMNKLS